MLNYRKVDFINPPKYSHDIIRSVPKGWDDKPIEERDWCPKCGHPWIKGCKCIYCGGKG